MEIGFLAKNRLIAHFVPNFVAMATRTGGGEIWLAEFDGPTPTPRRRKNLADISYRSRVVDHFVLISLPWQRGSVGRKYKWHC